MSLTQQSEQKLAIFNEPHAPQKYSEMYFEVNPVTHLLARSSNCDSEQSIPQSTLNFKVGPRV